MASAPHAGKLRRVIRENKYVAHGFKNSILTTIPCTLILLFTTSMASYVLARNNSKFYKVLYSLFITAFWCPSSALCCPCT